MRLQIGNTIGDTDPSGSVLVVASDLRALIYEG